MQGTQAGSVCDQPINLLYLFLTLPDLRARGPQVIATMPEPADVSSPQPAKTAHAQGRDAEAEHREH
jgi:hypothetical protein